MSIVQHNGRSTSGGGVTGKGFRPGQSGNPGGRPKGLTRRVRDLVGDDGEMIATYMHSVMLDETERTADRMEAAKWLSDRGFGRAAQAIEIEIEQPDQLNRLFGELSNEDLASVISIVEKYEGVAGTEALTVPPSRPAAS